MSLKPHVYWMFYRVCSICCITIGFWVVTKVIVKSSFELKRVRWRTKFARLMRVSLRLMLLNVTWNLPWNISKRWEFRKMLLAHTISYIFPWKLLFTIVVSWERHIKENQQGQFYASHVETAWILPSLQKSGVNIVCANGQLLRRCNLYVPNFICIHEPYYYYFFMDLGWGGKANYSFFKVSTISEKPF